MDLKTLLQNNGIDEAAITKLEMAISKHISDGFVAKQLYKDKLAELETAKTDLQTANDSVVTAEMYKTKWETAKKDFETYKTNVTNEKTTSAQNKALHEALKAAGANEKFISLVIDKVDRTKAVFDGDIDHGFTIKNSDEIVKPVKEQYGDIFGVVTVKGADPASPPKGESVKNTTGNQMNDFILKAAGKI